MRKVGVTLLPALLIATGASAQTVEPAPVRQSIDANGVDLFLGTLNVSREDLSMGNNESGISYSRLWRNGSWVDNYDIHMLRSGNTITVTRGGVAETFNYSYAWLSNQGQGSTLEDDGGGIWTYTTRDGTAYLLDGSYTYSGSDYARVARITKPAGEILTFSYETASCENSNPQEPTCGPILLAGRLSNVGSNLGYALGYTYAGNDIDTPAQRKQFYTITGTMLTNGANGVSRSASYTNQTGATDMAGRSWGYQISGLQLTDIQRPGRGYDIHIDYDGGGRVSGYRNAANITTGYTYSDDTGANERTTTITVGINASSYAVFDLSTQLMKRSVDENGLTTSYEHDGYGRLTKVTAPEGNSVEYSYDARGNVTQATSHRKSWDTRGDIATFAGYETGCSNPKTCNQPNWTKDARGNQTDYTYDGGSGLILTVNRPAYTDQSGNQVHPYQVYDYTTVNSPWGGSLTLLAGTRTCQSGSWGCGGANVVGSAYYYNGSGGNFLLQKVDTGARDGSLYGEVAYGYDDVRNVTSVTDPNGQVWRSAYDAARRPYWTITPDPDGGGAMRGKMVVNNYNGDGTVQSQQVGTGNPDGTSFYEYYHTVIDYDGAGRKAAATQVWGGTSYTKTQWSYDSIGRPDCTAVRINPGNYGSLPDACTLSTQGSDGPDRISRIEYDPASRVTRSWASYGTAQAVHVDQEWTNNGKLHHVYAAASDPNARGPATSYEYDGFDRLQYTCFNTSGCTGADYEQYDYDADGNQIWRRLRDGNVMTMGYDALGRLTSRTPPAYTFRDVAESYRYDNLGHVTQVQLAGAPANMGVAMTYDALGRLKHEQQPWIATDYGYDAAGNRTLVGYGDGYTATYLYDTNGRMTDVLENGQTLLAHYIYDELGRRTALGRANASANTYYSYGSGPWLTAMTHDLAGMTYDLTTAYTYNAAGQITQKTGSNETYAWAQYYNVSRGYQVNNLDQYIQSGSVTLGYDARGNLATAPTPNVGGNGATSGTISYSYTADNLISQATNGSQTSPFNYDALGRLTMDQTGNRLFGYAGTQLLMEEAYDGSAKTRYVYGADEAPLIRYEPGGTRRWLYADERGSVIAIADDQGNEVSINRYDEFGIPANYNDGRFGYTGQMWLPSLNLWHYKARTYSPTLGRFLQTDPIGYGDGLNWYNYTHGDPVNGIDPGGTKDGTVTYLPNDHSDRGPPAFQDGPIYASMLSGASYAALASTTTVYHFAWGTGADGKPYISADSHVEGGFSTAADFGSVSFGPQNGVQLASSVQDNKAYHDQQVAAAAKTFQSQGYRVIFNVSFRTLVLGPNGNFQAGARAVADFVAVRGPGDRFIFEMKTGAGDFSANQRQVYPLNGAIPVIPTGANAVAAGFEPGQIILVVPNELRVQRVP